MKLITFIFKASLNLLVYQLVHRTTRGHTGSLLGEFMHLLCVLRSVMCSEVTFKERKEITSNLLLSPFQTLLLFPGNVRLQAQSYQEVAKLLVK